MSLFFYVKYHNKSYSVLKIVFRNVAVQTIFRIVSAVPILKTIRGIESDILLYLFNHLARIPDVALLVPPMVPHTTRLLELYFYCGCFYVVVHHTLVRSFSVSSDIDWERSLRLVSLSQCLC